PDAARLMVAALAPYRDPGLRIGSARRAPAVPTDTGDPLEGLNDEMAAELGAINASMGTYSATQMAAQRVSTVLPLVKAEARAMGLEFDEHAPGALETLRESLRAY